MSTRALLLAALLVLAGCDAPLSGPGGEATPSESVTPATVPDETLAPGVTERGIVDLQRLVEAHRDAFRDGVVRTHRHRQTWANGTRALLVERRIVGSDSCRRYLFTSTATVGQQAPSEFALYANGTHVFRRRAGPGGNSTELLAGPSGERRRPCSIGVMDPLGDERLYAALGRGSFDVRASDDRLRLVARNVPMQPILTRAGRIRNVTADVAVVVTREGAVQRLQVGYEGQTDAGRVLGVKVDRFEPSEGVERPAWAANATR